MIGDHTPPQFEKGQRLTAASLNQIVKSVSAMIKRLYGPALEQPQEILCILDGALGAATNSKTGPASATATVCKWNASTQELEELSRTETVWNHSETAVHATDTFGVARWIAGHWVFFGDCEAMGVR